MLSPSVFPSKSFVGWVARGLSGSGETYGEWREVHLFLPQETIRKPSSAIVSPASFGIYCCFLPCKRFHFHNSEALYEEPVSSCAPALRSCRFRYLARRWFVAGAGPCTTGGLPASRIGGSDVGRGPSGAPADGFRMEVYLRQWRRPSSRS